MMTKTLESQGIGAIVMIGAGLCTALLFTVAQQGTFQAFMLGCVTPLPIMISTLGFGPAIGFGSAAIATLTVAVLSTIHLGAPSAATLIAGAITGSAFAVIQALPAWWLGLISCLARPESGGRWQIQGADKKPAQLLAFYPAGRIVTHAAVIVICLVGLGLGAVVLRYGGFDAALDHLTEKLSPVVEKLIEARPELRSGFDIPALTQIVLKTLPSFIAGWSLMMFLGNLWLAGRVVQTSHKLPRPWPDIARDLRMPRLLALALAAGGALTLVKGWPSVIGLIILAAIGLSFALQGLAVVHVLSRGNRWRVFLLFVIYLMLVVFVPWPLAIFALIGLADTAFSFRDRKAAVLSTKP